MNPKEEKAGEPASLPQCKREKYGGGGCPSPRLCEICDTGPCVKSQAAVIKIGADP